MATTDNTVLMEDVTLIFRNFAGKEGQYNREGDRNFGVLLSPEVAQDMLRAGWNVKFLKAREDGGEEQAWLSVTVNFDNRPPKVVQVTSRGRTHLGPDEAELLDWADLVTVDLIVRPYEWVVNGKSGVKAYLQSIYATVDEDPLDLKYAELDTVRNNH